jgi:hypothetical protein
MTPDPNNTAGSDCQERLVRLLARFRRFASARREVADRWSKKGTPRVAEEMRNSADEYDRCAAELERTINGEIPADPGCDWPYLDSDGHDHDCVRCDLMADIDCDTKYPGERGTCCVCVDHGCEEARAERAKHPILETNKEFKLP